MSPRDPPVSISPVLGLETRATTTGYQNWLFVLFFETGFLCSFGACLGTRSVDQAGLELTEIHVPLPLSAGIKGVQHHCPA